MIRRLVVLGLLASLTALPACAGGPGVEDPLAPVPTDVDPEDVAPPNLREAWSVEVELEGSEGGDDGEDEEEAPRPTRRPALGVTHVYVAFGDRLVALGIDDGEPRWEVSAPGPIAVAPVVTAEEVVAIAAAGSWSWISADGRVLGVLAAEGVPDDAVAVGARIVEIRGTEVRAIGHDPEHGPSVVWTRSLEGASSITPSPGSDAVLVADEEGVVHALAVAGGAVRWHQEEARAVAGAIGVDERRAYVAGRDRHLRALDLDDGDVEWRSRPFGVDLAGAPAVADGVVWVGGMTTALQGLDADSGSSLFRVRLPSRSYLDLVKWERWVVASPTYGPWTVVRAPLERLGPANPGSPVSYTVSSGGSEIVLAPAAGPAGVALVDASGTVRLLTPQQRGPLRSPRSRQEQGEDEG